MAWRKTTINQNDIKGFVVFYMPEKFDTWYSSMPNKYQIVKIKNFPPKGFYYKSIGSIDCFDKFNYFGFIKQIWIGAK